MTIQVTGRISGVPGIGATNVALLPVAALGPPPRPTPSLMLVDGSGLDAARLHADVSRALPGGTVTLRATPSPRSPGRRSHRQHRWPSRRG